MPTTTMDSNTAAAVIFTAPTDAVFAAAYAAVFHPRAAVPARWAVDVHVTPGKAPIYRVVDTRDRTANHGAFAFRSSAQAHVDTLNAERDRLTAFADAVYDVVSGPQNGAWYVRNATTGTVRVSTPYATRAAADHVAATMNATIAAR